MTIPPGNYTREQITKAKSYFNSNKPAYFDPDTGHEFGIGAEGHSPVSDREPITELFESVLGGASLPIY